MSCETKTRTCSASRPVTRTVAQKSALQVKLRQFRMGRGRRGTVRRAALAPFGASGIQCATAQSKSRVDNGAFHCGVSQTDARRRRAERRVFTGLFDAGKHPQAALVRVHPHPCDAEGHAAHCRLPGVYRPCCSGRGARGSQVCRVPRRRGRKRLHAASHGVGGPFVEPRARCVATCDGHRGRLAARRGCAARAHADVCACAGAAGGPGADKLEGGCAAERSGSRRAAIRYFIRDIFFGKNERSFKDGVEKAVRELLEGLQSAWGLAQTIEAPEDLPYGCTCAEGAPRANR
jgi:hypothetical protein